MRSVHDARENARTVITAYGEHGTDKRERKGRTDSADEVDEGDDDDARSEEVVLVAQAEDAARKEAVRV